MVTKPGPCICITAALISLCGCVTPKPRINPPAGLYQCPVTATITDQRSGATIFYTTDGTRPTASSSTYKSPLAIASSQNLKAFAKSGGARPSSISSSSYTCSVTRAEFAVLLVQQLHLHQPPHPELFTDVNARDNQYDAIQAAAPFMNPQILCPGCQLTRAFHPDFALTREIAAVALVRVLLANNRVRLASRTESERTLGDVPDAKGLPAAAKPYFATAISSHILPLMPGNTLQVQHGYAPQELKVLLDDLRTRFNLPAPNEPGVPQPNL